MNQNEKDVLEQQILEFYHPQSSENPHTDLSDHLKMSAADGKIITTSDEMMAHDHFQNKYLKPIQFLDLEWELVSESENMAVISAVCESLVHDQQTSSNRILQRQNTFVFEKQANHWYMVYTQQAWMDPAKVDQAEHSKSHLLNTMSSYLSNVLAEHGISRPGSLLDKEAAWQKMILVTNPEWTDESYKQMERQYLRICRNEHPYKLLSRSDKEEPFVAFTTRPIDGYYADAFIVFLDRDKPNLEWGVWANGEEFKRELEEKMEDIKAGKAVLLSPGRLAAQKILAIGIDPVYGIFTDAKQETFLEYASQGMKLAHDHDFKSLVITDTWRPVLNTWADAGGNLLSSFAKKAAVDYGMDAILLKAGKSDLRRAFRQSLPEVK